MQPPNTRRVLLSVADAAVRLGISQTEVRRQVTAGKLEAEKFDRPQGSYIRVVFYEPEDTPAPAVPENEPAHQDTPAIVARLVDKLDERDETIRVLSRENADLRERVGRAETRADMLQAERDAAAARAEAAEAELAKGRRWWWRRLLGE